MGIDLLDISFRLEKVFNLNLGKTFWNEVFERARRDSPGTVVMDVTVQQIHCELVCRLQAQGRYEETSYLTEENLKDVLTKLQIQFPLTNVSPETQIQELFGRPLWREDWDVLSDIFGVELPSIAWSKWTLIVLGAGITGCAVIWVVSRLTQWPWVYAIMFDIFVIASLLAWRLNSESKRFPPQIRSVKHLAEFVLVSRTRRGLTAKWADEVIWFSLREVLVDGLGVDDDEVTPTATLIHDLGAS